MCLFEGIFLPPLNDGGRADPLHNPMVNRAIWTRIKQDVCNVIANGESRIGRLGGLLCRYQLRLLLIATRIGSNGNESCCTLRYIKNLDGCPAEYRKSNIAYRQCVALCYEIHRCLDHAPRKKQHLRLEFVGRAYLSANRAFTWALIVTVCGVNSSVGAGMAVAPAVFDIALIGMARGTANC